MTSCRPAAWRRDDFPVSSPLPRVGWPPWERRRWAGCPLVAARGSSRGLGGAQTHGGRGVYPSLHPTICCQWSSRHHQPPGHEQSFSSPVPPPRVGVHLSAGLPGVLGRVGAQGGGGWSPSQGVGWGRGWGKYSINHQNAMYYIFSA